jgi:alkylation response protein AidB-like acyl-CoA dehydrogenase
MGMETSIDWLAQAAKVALEVLAVHADKVDREACWPAESLAALEKSGLMGLTVPTEYGGAGLGPRTFAAVVEMLAEQCASTAMIYLMHTCGTQLIAAAARFVERERVLRSIAAGSHLSTLAFSEKGSRSHFWSPVSQAVIEGDTHRLSAEKSFVTSANRADSCIVSTRSASSPEPTALTLYFVARGTPGISVNAGWTGLGLRGNDSAPMSLKGVRIPASYRLSSEGQGFAMMMQVAVPWFQLGSAAVAIGIARVATLGIRQHLLDIKLEHLGQPLAALANLRAGLAQMQIVVDTHQAYLERVAELMEHPGPELLLALLEVKAAAGEAALRVTDLAMRIGGGAAYSGKLKIERNFRDARACSIMAPTSDALYDFVGRTLLNMPLFG